MCNFCGFNEMKLSYQDAGVDIDTGNELVEEIKPIVKKTNRPGVVSNIGGFGGLFDLKKAGFKDPIIVAATDGVGTKLKLAVEMANYSSIGQDLVAMCVNDLICQGAEPLFFLDYYATGKLDLTTGKEIISGISSACISSGCALIGGETAEMPGVYQNGDFDLAGFAVGAVERGNSLPKTITEGDCLLALPSSGIHSNGFSLVRKVLEKSELTWHDTAPFCDNRLGDIFLRPTRLYVREILTLFKHDLIKGVAHITGGGLTENIPRILNDNLGGIIDKSSWSINDEFKWLQSVGNIHEDEMFKTFNCGIGIVIVVDQKMVNETLTILNDKNLEAFQIGEITNSGRLIYNGKLV